MQRKESEPPIDITYICLVSHSLWHSLLTGMMLEFSIYSADTTSELAFTGV